jgi:hypothetical protein
MICKRKKCSNFFSAYNDENQNKMYPDVTISEKDENKKGKA